MLYVRRPSVFRRLLSGWPRSLAGLELRLARPSFMERAAWPGFMILSRLSPPAPGSQPRSSGGIPAVCGDEFLGRETRPGWTVGVGIEYPFMTNWSVKLEYDYMDFGHRSVFLDDGLGNFFTEDIHRNMQMLKGGVNYRLAWGQPAAVSAYAYQGQPAHRHVHHHAHAGMPAAVQNDDDDDDQPSHVIPFIGTDLTKSSFFGWAGGLIAPWGDLDTSGPRVWIFGGIGIV